MKIDEQTVLTFSEEEIGHLIDAASFAMANADIPPTARAFFINLLSGLGTPIDDEPQDDDDDDIQVVH